MKKNRKTFIPNIREIIRRSFKKRLSSPVFWFEQILDLLIPAAVVLCIAGFITVKIALIPVVAFVVYELIRGLLNIKKELASAAKGEANDK